jgi:hypothetical protein
MDQAARRGNSLALTDKDRVLTPHSDAARLIVICRDRLAVSGRPGDIGACHPPGCHWIRGFVSDQRHGVRTVLVRTFAAGIRTVRTHCNRFVVIATRSFTAYPDGIPPLRQQRSPTWAIESAEWRTSLLTGSGLMRRWRG